MLINIFWTYVININKALDNKAIRGNKRSNSGSSKPESSNFYKLHDDNDTVDGDAETKLQSRLINTRSLGGIDFAN